MAGKSSAAMLECMRLIRAGMVPYQAAAKAGIDRPTLYKSRLYRAWKAAQPEKKP